MIWDNTPPVAEPDDPYDDKEMDYEMLKRRGWYKKGSTRTYPGGLDPKKKINFGDPPHPSPAPKPKPTVVPPAPVAPRRKT